MEESLGRESSGAGPSGIIYGQGILASADERALVAELSSAALAIAAPEELAAFTAERDRYLDGACRLRRPVWISSLGSGRGHRDADALCSGSGCSSGASHRRRPGRVGRGRGKGCDCELDSPTPSSARPAPVNTSRRSRRRCSDESVTPRMRFAGSWVPTQPTRRLFRTRSPAVSLPPDEAMRIGARRGAAGDWPVADLPDTADSSTSKADLDPAWALLDYPAGRPLRSYCLSGWCCL